MPQERPLPGEIYRHFKNRIYQIIAIAKDAETGEKKVVYQAMYGDYTIYVRSLEEFISPVDRKKYPAVSQSYRFQYQGMIGEGAGCGTDAMKDQKTEEPDQMQYETLGEEIGVHPGFLRFLDEDSYDKKYEIVSGMEEELDDHLINQMAASIDEIIEDGRLPERIWQLKSCLKTKARYEQSRFR